MFLELILEVLVFLSGLAQRGGELLEFDVELLIVVVDPTLELFVFLCNLLDTLFVLIKATLDFALHVTVDIQLVLLECHSQLLRFGLEGIVLIILGT